MHSFTEIQFPPEISYGSKGGPMFSTNVISSFSGHEQRNINWRQARARYDVASGVKSQEQMNELISFFLARRGRAIGFRFKDWSDYRANNQMLGKSDGKLKKFQLIKDYKSIGQQQQDLQELDQHQIYQRIITKPIANSHFNIYVESVKLNRGSDYKVDFTKGIIELTEPQKKDSLITADFEFDVPVRFDTDHLDSQIDSFEISSWNNIPIIEVRV